MAENPTARKLPFAGVGESWLTHASVPVTAILCEDCGSLLDISITPPNGQPDFYLEQHEFRTSRDIILDFWRLHKTIRMKKEARDEAIQTYGNSD